MQKTEILVVGKNPEIMKVIARLLNSNPQWNGTCILSVAEAIEASATVNFNLVLLGAGLNEDEAKQLQAHFTVPVIQHYGGGSGLLSAQIYGALSK
jgi:CheY-like chemotaxis protein